ncbi:hydrolase [Alteromonas genovensis]|uniref:Hydrolase n=1 Tax=Alteromonas genovensis TaxID=471225 RepID=A0A6N9TAJ9_9ALTE|nr:lipocalin-like domain-containing protein [Alteromonas genovensis]NDW14327.1 hydrolase [Alteromonas genovensis]
MKPTLNLLSEIFPTLLKRIEPLKFSLSVAMAVCVLTCSACSDAPAPSRFFGDLSKSNSEDSAENGSSSDSSTGSFQSVNKTTPLVLPKDHGSHPDYQLEWWYLTFVLGDDENNEYGLQFTLFRFATAKETQIASSWSTPQQWMGHASLHAKDEHFFEERLAAGGVGNAFVKPAPFNAVIDDWSWQSKSDSPFPATLQFSINNNVDIALSLTAKGPFVKQGDKGYSKKTEDARLRSYYYSQPFIDASGTLDINNTTFNVKGLGWYDHEWTSHLANSNAMGWDWFSLHLDDGSKLMAFRMHATGAGTKGTKNRGSEIYTTASYITASGDKETLALNEISIMPLDNEQITTLNTERDVPTTWQITIPSKDVDITVSPFKSGQWNSSVFEYYEGRVNVTGTHKGAGFMELTGY